MPDSDQREHRLMASLSAYGPVLDRAAEAGSSATPVTALVPTIRHRPRRYLLVAAAVVVTLAAGAGVLAARDSDTHPGVGTRPGTVPGPTQSTTTTPTTSARPTIPTTTNAPALGLNGYGPIRLGMSKDEALATGLVRAGLHEFTPASDGYLCGMLTNVEFDPETARGGAPFTALYDERGIAYIEISKSSYRTDIGLNVGDSLADVERTLGVPDEQKPSEYGDAHEQYFFDDSGGRGWRVTVSIEGTVTNIRRGRADAIRLVEGCL